MAMPPIAMPLIIDASMSAILSAGARGTSDESCRIARCRAARRPSSAQSARRQLLHEFERARDVRLGRNAADRRRDRAVAADHERGPLGEAVVDLIAAGVGRA